jgi:microcystin-dependent protein
LGTKVYNSGKTDGVESVTLDMASMPAHTHQLQKKNTSATGPDGKTAVPDNKSDLGGLSSTAGGSYFAVLPTGPANTALNASTLGAAGAASVASHENRQPFLGLYFAIATEGVFPERP